MNQNLLQEDGSTSLTLLERAKRNEATAWDRLVFLYAPVVYLRCRKHWRFSASDSDQIGQEVFLAIARNLSNFERQRSGSFRKWMRTIVDNKCKDEIKKQQIATAVGGTEARRMFENLVVQSSSGEDPHSDDEKTTLMNQAMKLVESDFSSRDWKMFWRVEVDVMNRQSVAEEFEVTDNVVYIVCSRIRSRLKNAFQDLLDDDVFAS